ncbi:MAG TPA: sel1 repeat family protein, partial [Nitrospirales bacterium]|nr:sel1 repeat family protein [Nitrospirales bacterium]HIO22552.1 sel1 repeat family protein [Nitrospirales bacterium]
LAILLGVVGTSCGGDSDKGLAVSESDAYATALSEWRPLAEQGDAEAQVMLGWMYATGKGVRQDNVYAHMWVNIAASQGHEDAAKKRDIVAKKMTSADISAAQKLARECVGKEYKGC